MCDVLRVSKSGYYAWRDRAPSPRVVRQQELSEKAKEFHAESHHVYGYRKVHQDLLATGIRCCAETVRRVMKKAGIRSRTRRKYVVTTDSNHDRPVAENLLNRDFEAAGPNEKWVADITYIHTKQGWLYLAGVMDLFSRRLVGWAMSDRIDSRLTCDALTAAVQQRLPGGALLHHSDRGTQYASAAFAELLALHGIASSMSRKGNAWDNACMERFFCSLKTEWSNHKTYRTREQAKQSIFEYIELFYNRKRRHEALGYLSPADYEEESMKGKNQEAA